MSAVIAWMAAETERATTDEIIGVSQEKAFNTGGTEEHRGEDRRAGGGELVTTNDLPAHQFPSKQVDSVPIPLAEILLVKTQDQEDYPDGLGIEPEERYEAERERRIYRARTVAMLRRYMKFSIETGRLPSVLGREFFRAKVTSYKVGTFEDRVIFVHDMEICLERLDEFSRQLIGRHILQEHDQEATGRLLGCTERTVRTYVPVVLDVLSEILLEVGLMERLSGESEKSCQGGLEGQISVSDCEERENKF